MTATAVRGDGRLAIEFISVLGLRPVEFVHLARDLGCAHIGLALNPLVKSPDSYQPWSLRDDAALRRETLAALRETGVSVSQGEGFLVTAGADIADAARDMDLLCELGAPRVNILSIDPDRGRSFDQFAEFARMAADRGLQATLEFMPGLTVPDLPTALAALDHVGQDHFRLLIDTLHLVRSGGSAGDLAALSPDRIGYAQLCDAPLAPTISNYGEEASHHRLAPGEGELPLRAILDALPRNIVIGLETPRLDLAQAGVGPHQRLSAAVDRTRRMLAALEA